MMRPRLLASSTVSTVIRIPCLERNLKNEKSTVLWGKRPSMMDCLTWIAGRHAGKVGRGQLCHYPRCAGYMRRLPPVGRGQLPPAAYWILLIFQRSWHGYRIMSFSIRFFSIWGIKSASKGEIDVAEFKRINGRFVGRPDRTACTTAFKAVAVVGRAPVSAVFPEVDEDVHIRGSRSVARSVRWLSSTVVNRW